MIQSDDSVSIVSLFTRVAILLSAASTVELSSVVPLFSSRSFYHLVLLSFTLSWPVFNVPTHSVI